MKQATTKNLLSYWNTLRAERMAPERDCINPSAIPNLLQDTFILEVDPARTFPVRVAGARMTSLFARELKGEAFASLFRDRDRECLDALIRAVLDDAAPAVAGVSGAPVGRAPLELELLLLPLRHHGKTHSRLLGSLAPAAIPAWMGLIETAPLSITTLRMVRPGSLKGIEPFQQPLQEPAWQRGDNHRAGQSALRVVNGGRNN